MACVFRGNTNKTGRQIQCRGTKKDKPNGTQIKGCSSLGPLNKWKSDCAAEKTVVGAIEDEAGRTP